MTSAHRTFIRSWICFSLLGLLLVAGLNIAVDPYSVFGTPRVVGFNALKPSIGTKVRMAKVHQVMTVRPKAIVIGNSRPEIGLDPDHPCWPAANGPVYNAAVPGISVYGQIRYGQHAMASGEVGLILIGLDFVDFLVAPDMDRDPRAWPVVEHEPMRLRVDALGQSRPAFRLDRLKDQLSATLSLDALGDTVATLIQQRPGSTITRTALGLNPGQPIFGPIIRHEGIGILFAQKNRTIAARLSAHPWSLVHRRFDWSTSFEALLRLFRQARGEGIRIIPFINPLHADFLVLIDQAKLWPLMDEWKERVVTIAAEEGGVSVWDFSGFDDHATETVNHVAAKGESLEWFWEPAHYRKALGDKMLSAMLAESCAGPKNNDAWGTALTPSTIQDHLAKQRAGRDAYTGRN